MGNWVFKELVKEQIEMFLFAFSSSSKSIFIKEKDSTKKLIHPGEYGTYKEAVCKEFLKFITPQALDISTGFILSQNDEISSQCDLVIYDTSSTPFIRNKEKQKFFPIETIAAIGEVKSDLSKSELKKALLKLGKIKKMREKIPSPFIVRRKPVTKEDWEALSRFNENPQYAPRDWSRDQICTFVICQKLTFDFTKLENIKDLYPPDFDFTHRHNIILSIEDGLLLYQNAKVTKEGSPALLFDPFIAGIKNNYGAYTLTDSNQHIKLFMQMYFQNTTYTTILFPEMVNYLS